jgi:hypothetical protein
LVQADRPTRLPPARLPLDVFQKFARYARTEFVGAASNVGANTIHFVCDIVSRMAGQVLLHRVPPRRHKVNRQCPQDLSTIGSKQGTDLRFLNELKRELKA